MRHSDFWVIQESEELARYIWETCHSFYLQRIRNEKDDHKNVSWSYLMMEPYPSSEYCVSSTETSKRKMYGVGTTHGKLNGHSAQNVCNWRHVRFGAENDRLHIPHLFDFERTETPGNPILKVVSQFSYDFFFYMVSWMKIASFKLHCIPKNKRYVLYTSRRMCLTQQIELDSVANMIYSTVRATIKGHD